ncbi:hypothetical protein PIB30_028385 [Stylosanthes scabra]|uniref:LYR motif containing domain-containing protein n=1 Tax=Stylosanthes scabra TaxID=79078 RepID=A0ABU6TBP1_9FABA|nr:hypothetical protein [Stylosanthes scabra]
MCRRALGCCLCQLPSLSFLLLLLRTAAELPPPTSFLRSTSPSASLPACALLPVSLPLRSLLYSLLSLPPWFLPSLVPAKKMGSGLIWATAEDLAKNRGRVLLLYRQILRSLNSPKLPLSFPARLARKAEVRAMFWVGSDERSLHNIADLIDAAEYSLSFLKKGELPPRYIT